jgi:tetratricopeptide (TPR) repeat protein
MDSADSPVGLAALAALLKQALDLEPPAREAWLAQLRTQRPADAAELERLLTEEAALDAAAFLSPESRELQAPMVPGLSGRRVGAYTLERPLGQGGMGTVWLARRSDGRYEGWVAVKLLSLGLLNPVGSERFRREGTLLARLSHPGIARLLDAGVTVEGQPYLVLEHVEGVRLDAYATERQLSIEARLRLFLEVLAAVGHAHANLVVHRDLKPSNILVTADGRIKLLDFGIARLLEADPAETGSATLTDLGVRALTPEYAAPEQVTGAPVTTATDVYALGVLLYVLLSGRHPTAQGRRTTAEVIRALEEVEPARLGLGDLDTILTKALRKAPGERYQTVAALADDLERYLRHQPVRARADSRAYRAAKFVRRNRVPLALATLVLAALVGATVFSVAQMREARRQRDAAVHQARRAQAQSEFQNLLISQVGDRPITFQEILDHARRTMEVQYAGDPRFLGPLLLEMSERYSELGDHRARTALLTRAESLIVAGQSDIPLVAVRCEMGDNLRSQGRYDEARAAFREADSLLGPEPDPDVLVRCLETKAFFEGEVGDTGYGEPTIRRAIAVRDSLGEGNTFSTLQLYSTLAAALAGQNRDREAVAVYDQVIRGLDSAGRANHVLSTITLHDKALTLLKLGRTAEAERLLHEVVVRMARNDPVGRVPTQPLVHYAETALEQGHADSALRYFAQLLEEGIADSSRYWQGRAAFGLARAQIRRGLLAEGRATTERFRRLSEGFPAVTRTDDQVPDVGILGAWLSLATGDTAAALAGFAGALERHGYYQGKRLSRLRPIALLVGRTALALGNPDTALVYARGARRIATLDSLTETSSARVGEGWLLEGRALLAKGDTAGARGALRRAATALRSGAGEADERSREAEGWLIRVGS